MSNESEFPKYIKNELLGKDLLKGKSHEKLSKSLINHLKDPKHSPQLIGLEGKWGSGKSNLLKILENELPTHHFFTFDLWANQNNNIRNTFLSELTSFLLEKGKNRLRPPAPIPNENGARMKLSWNDKLDQVFSQKKTTEKRELPKISVFGILLLIIYFVHPIISPFLEQMGANEIGRTYIAQAILGFGIFYIFYSIAEFLSGSLKNKYFSSFTSWFYILKGKRLNSNTTEIIRNNQSSVADFRQYMADISKCLNVEIVIVYDNMDRMKPDQIHSIWASIHTFFAEKEYSKIWTIVAFDKSQIKSSFSETTITHSDESQSEKFKSTNVNKTNEFIRKTFPIVYKIPPPILTNWKDFFRAKLKTAFGDTPIQSQETIINLYELSKREITARNIIHFINELVKLKKTWKEEFDNKYYALYILNEDCLRNSLPISIINRQFDTNSAEHFTNDSEVQDIMTCLAYNIERSIAKEVTLKTVISDCLKTNGDWDKIIEYPGYLDVLSSVISERSEYIEKYIVSLNQVLVDHPNEKESIISRNFFNTLSNYYISSSPNNVNTKTLKILHSHCPPQRLSLLKKSADIINRNTNLKTQDLATTIKEIEIIFTQNQLQNHFKATLHSGEEIRDFILELGKGYSKYIGIDEINILDEFISSELTDSKTLEIGEFLSDDHCYYLEKTILQINQSLSTFSHITVDTIPTLMKLLRSITRKDPDEIPWTATKLNQVSSFRKNSTELFLRININETLSWK